MPFRSQEGHSLNLSYFCEFPESPDARQTPLQVTQTCLIRLHPAAEYGYFCAAAIPDDPCLIGNNRDPCTLHRSRNLIDHADPVTDPDLNFIQIC